MPTPAHVVYISIVGCDRNPYRYYRMKHEAERALQGQSIPATVLRATQFHSLAAAMSSARIGPVSIGLRGMTLQPVDIAWVGERLAELATVRPPTGFRRATDIAGPDRLTSEEIAELVSRHTGSTPRWRLRLPALGATMHAFADGAILPGPEAELGGSSFAHWLAQQPTDLPRR